MGRLFNDSIIPEDDTYRRLRDEKECLGLRSYLENLWEKYEPYADRHFQTEMSKQFHQRFWELYLASVLIEAGMQLVRTGDNQPDICVTNGCRKIWIEATAPEAGKGEDRVPPPVISTPDRPRTGQLPTDNIILRLTGAFKKKSKSYSNYIEKGLIGIGDPYIIAINGARVPHSEQDSSTFPRIAKAILGLGDLFVTFDKKTAQVTKRGIIKREYVVKDCGAQVGVNYFNEAEYSVISGVIYSVACVFYQPSPELHDLLYVRNHNASCDMAKDWLPGMRECGIRESDDGQSQFCCEQ